MSTYLSTAMLARAVRRDPETVRRHIRQGWLKPEEVPGANGHRIKFGEAQKWAAKYFSVELQNS